MQRAIGLFLLLGVLITQCAPAKSRQGAPHKDVGQVLGGGKLVTVVVAPPKPSKADSESETYGDWAEYLNAFSSSLPADTKLIKLTPAQYQQTVEEPKIQQEYATVFLKDPTHCLLYNGMIVEAKAYKVGLDWLHGHPDEKAIASYGLKEKPAKLK